VDTDLVDRVEVSAYQVPTDQPEADGTFSWDSTTIVVVSVSAAGHTGIGWTYGPAGCAAVVRDELAAVVVGADPMNVPASWAAMEAAIRNAGRGGVAGYALSAVDVALWDLKARILDLALHRLLGSVRQTVPIYGSGGFTTYDENVLREQLTTWVHHQRIPRVKIKIGESWGRRTDRDLERIRQAREIIGSGPELFVDANGGYRAKQAIRVATVAEELDIRWLEEPVSSDDLDGLRDIRLAVTPEVTAGEYGIDLAYFERMLAARSVDCLQADISRCGGISEWMRVAALTAAHGLEISAHCAPHLHAHAAAATPNLRHLEWFHDHVRIEHMFFDGVLDPIGGLLTPDDLAAGHGLAFKAVDVEQYRVS
jgi:L-alanine-DL-glutamate epimerase-like enolase superfamily enzyme